MCLQTACTDRCDVRQGYKAKGTGTGDKFRGTFPAQKEMGSTRNGTRSLKVKSAKACYLCTFLQASSQSI
eukprot:scaffold146152_cov16-Tisochrysis_lutea.AAC.1